MSFRRAKDTVRVLIERINWPVRMVRVQVAREFADLLGSQKYRKLAARTYLDWICERELEAEVVSGLAILACVPAQNLLPIQQLKESIRRPSVLADLLIQSIYGRPLGGWLGAHSGEAPSSFESGKYFEKYKHSHVPPILDHAFEQLERDTGLPFRRQWNFEWQTIVDSTHTPLSSYPYHFTDWPNYRDSGVEGQFSQRQCDVYRSAYLRTLAFAVSTWKMPLRYAADIALFSLPVNRELVKLRPGRRPRWLSDIPERCCGPDAAIDNLVRDLVARADAKSRMRPVCMKIPLSPNVCLFGDLWIAAVLASSDYKPNGDDASQFVRGITWPLHDRMSFCGPLPKLNIAKFASQGTHGSAIPCCLDVLPLHMGFWHGDYYRMGVSIPAPYLFPGDLCIACREQRIEIVHDQTLFGTVSIWHDNWSPLHPRNGNTRCGLVADMRRTDIARAEEEVGLKLAWRARLRMWRREKDYGPFELTERQVFLQDS